MPHYCHHVGGPVADGRWGSGAGMIFRNLGLQSTSFITKAGFETSCKSSFRIVVIK